MIILKIALNNFSINTFYYKNLKKNVIPKKGTRVLVPFRDKTILGIVLSVFNKSKFNYTKLKKIKKILDKEPIFSEKFLSLLTWSAEYYHYPIGKILFYTLPQFLKNKQNIFLPFPQWKITEKGKKFFLKKNKNKIKNFLFLIQKKIFFYQINNNKKNFKILNNLKKQKIIQFILHQKKTKHQKNTLINQKININSNQKKIIKKINYCKKFIVWLLTGENKKEIVKTYIKITKNFLIQKKQILILVPEIKITYEFMKYFKKYFNIPIEIMHSKINNDEKFFTWLYTKNGNISILIGTRSSLFNSFKNLGLIIIDEEHNDSYKEKKNWTYHARNLAILRAKKENIPIILSSITPSTDSFYNIKNKKYFLLNLNEKQKNKKIIKKDLINLKEKSLKNSISNILIQKIKKNLKKNKKIMLILNNDQVLLKIICYKCNKIAKCKRCNTPYLLKKNNLYCYSCNKKKKHIKQCSICNSKKLKSIGTNTKKIKIFLKKIFLNTKIIKINKETILNTKKTKKTIKKIKNNIKFILITNPIISKIKFIPQIDIIAILNIDSILFSNNYRAIEKFAQFYIQVINKFSKKKTKIILQTYYPKNPIFSTLFHKKYLKIIKKILKERKELKLPPYSNHIILKSESYKNKIALNFLKKIKKKEIKKKNKNLNIFLIGPFRENSKKKLGLFQWKLIFQHHSKFLLKKYLEKILYKIHKNPKNKKVKWKIDVDPIKS